MRAWAGLTGLIVCVACEPAPNVTDPQRVMISRAAMSSSGFETAAPMSVARARAGAAVTTDGRVLVVGGFGAADLASSELYDPLTNTWSAGPSLLQARSSFVMRVSNGNTYAAFGGTAGAMPLQSVEKVSDLTSAAFTASTPMLFARSDFLAVKTGDGRFNLIGGSTTQTEVFDIDLGATVDGGVLLDVPTAGAAAATASGALVPGDPWQVLPPNGGDAASLSSDPGFGHFTAVALPDGGALIAGGMRGGGASPVAQFFTGAAIVSAPPLNAGRYDHRGTLLPSGSVMVVGGRDGGALVSSAEVLAPGAAQWNVVGDFQPVVDEVVVTLPEGQVLLAGGTVAAGSTSAVGLYDETAPQLAGTASPAAGAEACGAQLGDGRYLRVGPGAMPGTIVAEIYDPASSTWMPAQNPAIARSNCGAATLHDGRVLVVGGDGSAGVLGSTELYEPDSDTWSPGPALNQARSAPQVAILPTGEVMVSGGTGSVATLATTELFEPATNTFVDGGTMTAPRVFHALTLLWDGSLLATGGQGISSAEATTETWSVSQRTWVAGPTMSKPRFAHTATLMADRSVVVVGGANEAAASIERVDASLTVWSPLPPSSAKRDGHVAVRLPFNRLLLVSTGQPPERLDFVDSSASMVLPGSSPDVETAAMLPSGVVLLVGNGVAQLYDQRVAARADAPQLGAFGPVLAPSPTEATGQQFMPGLTGDDGKTAASPGDMPIALFRHLASGLVRVPVTENRDNSSVVLGVAGDFQPGWYAGTVTVNGVASNPQTFFLSSVCSHDADCSGAFCATDDLVCCPQPCQGTCETGRCISSADGGIDSGVPDSGIDAGVADAGPSDAGPIDAGPNDAGPSDGGSTDAGPADAGGPIEDGGFGPPQKLAVGCGCDGVGLSPFALLALLAWNRRRRSP